MNRQAWKNFTNEITVAQTALTNAQRAVRDIGDVVGSTNSLRLDMSHVTEEFAELRVFGTATDGDSNVLEIYGARGENDDYTHLGQLTCTTGTMVARGGSDLYVDTMSWSATDESFELVIVNSGNNDIAKAWINTNGYDRLLVVASTLNSTDVKMQAGFTYRAELPSTASVDAMEASLSAIETDIAALEVLDTVTKSVEVVNDWTAVAQNTIIESAEIDVSANKSTVLMLQAFLDTTTAHGSNGTDFIVQASAAASGNEDWHDVTTISAQLVGTAATDLIEDAPLAAGSTSLTLTGHALTTEGIWIGIEDSTLVNSELIFVASQSANAVVALDGTTNAHAVSTAVFNVAISRADVIDSDAYQRLRVIVDNTQEAAGSSLNFKLSAVKRTL